MDIHPLFLGLILIPLILLDCESNSGFPESEPMDYTEKRPVAEVARNLLSWLEEHQPAAAQSLNGPAEKQKIEDLETAIGRTLPPAFHELYLLHNGQREKEIALFPGGYEFLTLPEISREWETMKKVSNDPGFPKIESEPKGLFRDSLWEPGWVPFAKAISGDFLCIDLVPGPDGRKGQIIEFYHDDTYMRHRGLGMADFVDEFERGLRSGKYLYHEDWKSFVNRSVLE